MLWERVEYVRESRERAKAVGEIARIEALKCPYGELCRTYRRMLKSSEWRMGEQAGSLKERVRQQQIMSTVDCYIMAVDVRKNRRQIMLTTVQLLGQH